MQVLIRIYQSLFHKNACWGAITTKYCSPTERITNFFINTTVIYKSICWLKVKKFILQTVGDAKLTMLITIESDGRLFFGSISDIGRGEISASNLTASWETGGLWYI